MASPIPTQDWTLQQGDSQDITFKCKQYSIPGDVSSLVNRYDFTGAVIRMKVRLTPLASAVIELDSTTSTGNYIEVDAADNKVTLHITAAKMASVKAGTYGYDVECTFTDGKVVKLVKGSIEIEGEYTW